MDKQTVVREVIAMAPPSSVGGAMFFGVTFPELVMALTALYTVLNIAFLIYRWSKFDGKSQE